MRHWFREALVHESLAIDRARREAALRAETQRMGGAGAVAKAKGKLDALLARVEAASTVFGAARVNADEAQQAVQEEWGERLGVPRREAAVAQAAQEDTSDG